MASDLMTVAGLGRPFTLGMLYDARSDKLVPGLRLWNGETLKTTTRDKISSHINFNASDSIESKSNMMDIEASLKASFLCGLIEVGGSAKYLNDQKKSKNQSRVTFQFKATTHFKELLIPNETLDTKQREVIQKGLATHVVTGIMYGANAFFVFDSEKLEASQVKKIEGSMEAAMVKTFHIEGKVNLKLTAAEKALTEKFSCEFYGDFLLDRIPVTFKDAVQIYTQLPKLLKTKGENSVPVKVWLMPLKSFDPKAPELKTGISIRLVKKAQDVLEDLKEIRMRCNDSLEDSVEEDMPKLTEDIRTFQKVCDYYESSLQQTMAKKMPSIRAGKESESSLEEVFEDRKKSPFSHEKLIRWLDLKERFNIIWSCMDIMKGVKIVDSKNELERVARRSNLVACFVFTSTESADPYLETMDHYANSLKCASTEEEPWYYSDDVSRNMKQQAHDFITYANKCKDVCHFRIAFIEDKTFKGATIYWYKKGILQTEDF
ncbi:hypothetical protein JOQ06_026705 [Pogonophryne albipinna]|uniref:SNTX thioredoxin-like domain-containing protein n=1 Tax=Pogonophryne albipinna TaxID=1090488 RepID=A0AAD6BDZ3_9TELE|nr:hypothetical protein JOQ06_026705 [Pogonophryne albipinna]